MLTDNGIHFTHKPGTAAYSMHSFDRVWGQSSGLDYVSASELKQHLHAFRLAHEHARRLKTLKGKTPYAFVRQRWEIRNGTCGSAWGGPPPVSMANLPARATEALQRERFKEAIELFKTLLRQDPQPRWKEALADAYCGRARDLGAKGMFKEAAMVLENTLTPSGTLRDPQLYVTCLIRDGQQAKAAAYLLRTVAHPDVPASERAALEGLTAALLLTVPRLPVSPPPVHPEAARCRDAALAAREALAAWVDGASAEEMERHLNRISLRSAFRPLRLLLKSLLTVPPRSGADARTAGDDRSTVTFLSAPDSGRGGAAAGFGAGRR